jgi:hypothetical protein
MRTLAIAAAALILGAGAALAECDWTATASKSSGDSGVVAKSEQGGSSTSEALKKPGTQG